jgi:NADH-quinone oxidoreductase subunit I
MSGAEPMPAGEPVPAGERVSSAEPASADLPARSRGVIALLEENCTVCMLCARECPDWCIYIESHKEPVPGQEYSSRHVADPAQSGGGAAGPGPARAPAGRGRQRVRNVLDRFAIDFSLCMYCGICVEVCPYDALFWSPEFAYAETGIAGLTHEQDRLRTWMWTVPPPPAHDRGAPPTREVLAAGPGTTPAMPGG